MNEPIRWSIFWYQDSRGHRPAEEWLTRLEEKDQARVRRTFELLESYGMHLGMPHRRHVRGKIWELRVATGKSDYRILYVAVTGYRFILLHAFSKKTEKTPARELEIAETRLADYQSRSR